MTAARFVVALLALMTSACSQGLATGPTPPPAGGIPPAPPPLFEVVDFRADLPANYTAERVVIPPAIPPGDGPGVWFKFRCPAGARLGYRIEMVDGTVVKATTPGPEGCTGKDREGSSRVNFTPAGWERFMAKGGGLGRYFLFFHDENGEERLAVFMGEWTFLP
jgi:hypothetical protein